MAKISAYGATEVARIRCENNYGTTYLYVLCSDGRILYRPTGYPGTSYTVRGKLTKPEHINAEYLEKVVRYKDRMLPIA